MPTYNIWIPKEVAKEIKDEAQLLTIVEYSNKEPKLYKNTLSDNEILEEYKKGLNTKYDFYINGKLTFKKDYIQKII